jgi:putative transposase
MNATETLSGKQRTAVPSRGHFPDDDEAIKLIYLVSHPAERDGELSPRKWATAKNQFAILFGERFNNA